MILRSIKQYTMSITRLHDLGVSVSQFKITGSFFEFWIDVAYYK